MGMFVIHINKSSMLFKLDCVQTFLFISSGKIIDINAYCCQYSGLAFNVCNYFLNPEYPTDASVGLRLVCEKAQQNYRYITVPLYQIICRA